MNPANLIIDSSILETGNCVRETDSVTSSTLPHAHQKRPTPIMIHYFVTELLA